MSADGNVVFTDDPRVERLWVHNHHICVVILQPNLLHRCGYVYVAEGSPLEGMTLWDIDDCGFVVHGGITFADRLAIGNPDLPDIADWCFGFDCAHAGDAPDVEAGIKRYGNRAEYSNPYFKYMAERYDPVFGVTHIWTLDEVCSEVESLCDQITEFERRGLWETKTLTN